MFDDVSCTIVKRQVSYVPGLYKIFDEIIVNAADNKQRDENMSKLKVRACAARRTPCAMVVMDVSAAQVAIPLSPSLSTMAMRHCYLHKPL